MNVEVNYLGVFLAAVSSMVVGFIWYNPAVLGKPWMRASGLPAEGLKKAQKEMGKWYGVSFVLALVTAYVLSHVMTLSVNFFHYPLLSTGLITAFWMWLGFVMPVQVTGEIFGAKRWTLVAINTGYQLATLLVMGVILALL